MNKAAENGLEDVVRLLLGAPGINVNALKEFGQTPFHIVAQEGQEAVIRMLLHFAAQQGYADAVKVLLNSPKK